MEYLFRSSDGSEIARVYESGKQPKLFSWIRVRGKRYQRVPCSAAAPAVKPDFFVGHSLRKRGQPLAPDYDRLGIKCIREGPYKDVPVLTSAKQVREFCKRDDHPTGKVDYEW